MMYGARERDRTTGASAAGGDPNSSVNGGGGAIGLRAGVRSAVVVRADGFRAAEARATGFFFAATVVDGLRVADLRGAGFRPTALRVAGLRAAGLRAVVFEAAGLRAPGSADDRRAPVFFAPVDFGAGRFPRLGASAIAIWIPDRSRRNRPRPTACRDGDRPGARVRACCRADPPRRSRAGPRVRSRLDL